MKKDGENPIKESDISTHSDNKIDQDFPGFPFGKAKEDLINPKTEEDKKVASVNIKDGEKMDNEEKKSEGDENSSDGSGGAFDSTENMLDDDNDNSRSGK